MPAGDYLIVLGVLSASFGSGVTGITKLWTSQPLRERGPEVLCVRHHWNGYAGRPAEPSVYYRSLQGRMRYFGRRFCCDGNREKCGVIWLTVYMVWVD